MTTSQRGRSDADPSTGGTEHIAAPGLRDGAGPAEETYRSRMWEAAARRRVPLATIITTVLVGFIVLDLNALAILLLWVLRTILLYAIMGIFLALLLSPVVRLVERGRFGHGLSVVIVFLGSFIVLAAIIGAFTAPLVSAVTHFAKELPTLVTQAEHGKGRLGHLIKHFHLETWVKNNVPKLTHDITKSLKPAQAISVGSVALSTVVAIVVVAMLTLFILLEGPQLRRALLGSMRPERAARVAKLYVEVSGSVTGYMFGDFLTSVIAGVVVGVSLALLGVPYPWLLGLWVGLVDFLPLVGGLLAGVPVVVIAAFHSFSAAIIMLIIFVAYQEIENHVLYPVVMSKTVRLNPLWVLVAVLVGATLGGKIGSDAGAFVGALVSIPAAGAIQVSAREIRRGPTAPPEPAILEEIIEEQAANTAPADPGS